MPINKELIKEAIVLAQVRKLCCDEVATSVDQRSYLFALSVWKYIERQFPGMTPQEWNDLLDVK